MKLTYKERLIRQLMLQGLDRHTAQTTAAEIIAAEVTAIATRIAAAMAT